jgi:2-polyprenyl-6-methoxyphenol hydroxylase-like FAD-dependent oxidoreductase
MTSGRTALIAGGGIGGLSVATLLAQRGWQVRVLERGDGIREIGAGIYIKNNSIEVFEEMGVFDRLKPHGSALQWARVVDAQGKTIQIRDNHTGKARVWVFPRQALVETLYKAAVDAGVDVQTGRHVTGARIDGTLVMEDGREERADLIVGADGVHSAVRKTLAPESTYRALGTVINRYLLPDQELVESGVTLENWSGRRRIGITPCGADHTYVYQVSPANDPRAGALPNDIENWSAAFPHLRRAFEKFAEAEVLQAPYSIVSCKRWAHGRVALLGDAAHGMPPTLGQGAGITIINGRALVHFLDQHNSVEDAVGTWEQKVRFIADHTQRWALRYDYFSRQWPQQLWPLRDPIIWAFRNFPQLNRRMRIADRGLEVAGIPVGASPA